MELMRLVRHLLTSRRQVKRHFPKSCREAIEAAIGESEASHRGEIRFAVEAALEPSQVIRHMTPRERALDVFSMLRVWDTQENSGVLIYVLLADRAIEIVADRGIHARSGSTTWDLIANDMQGAFAEGEFEMGALNGIAAVSRELIRHLPLTGTSSDELPNDVKLL